MEQVRFTRRSFLRQWGACGAAWVARPPLRGWAGPALPNPVGYAAISWPDKEFEHALETISSLGFQGVQLLSWIIEAYPGPKAASLRDRLERLKLKPAVLSCWNVDLDPSKPQDETAAVRTDAAYLQALGGPYLQVTDGGNPHVKYSAQAIRDLGNRMNALGKAAQDHGITVGYHPHFGTIGETREGIARILDATNARLVKLILDVGHLTLSGVDPVEVVRTYHQRLVATHFKDVRKDVAALSRRNHDLVRKKEYQFCEIGRGVVDFPAILRAFREVDFRGWVIIEMDGNQPPPDGADESARINSEAARKLGLQV